MIWKTSVPLGSENDLHLLCWNIGGLNGATFMCIQEFLSGFHIVCLLEKGGSESRFELRNYLCIPVTAATKLGERGRHAGGMLVYISHQIEPFVTKIEVPYLRSNMLWFSYTPEAGKKYIAGFLYNPPKDSPYAITDVYEELFRAMEYVRRSVDPFNNQDFTVVILGDHNARTGQLPDEEGEVQGGAFQPDLTFDTSMEYTLPLRRSYDTVVNHYGRCLLEFCKSTELKIMNGRVDGDNDGFTYIGNTGRSTIDYAMVNVEGWHLVRNMSLHSRIESDHLPLSVSLLGDVADVSNQLDCMGDRDITQQIKRFKWNMKWAEDFYLKTSFFVYFLSGLINLIYLEPSHMLDSYIVHLQKIFELAGSKMLLRLSSGSGLDYLTSKIQKLKTKAKRKLRIFRRSRTNDALHDYLAAKQRWNERKKESFVKKQEREKAEIECALESKDMKTLWDQIKRITKGNLGVSSSITPRQWLQHFNELYNVTTRGERDEWRFPNLTYTDDMLDAEISHAEVGTTLMSMRNNKAPGWDGIPMEFYKYTPQVNQVFAQLFNSLYEKTLYPKSWALSIIQPIFKKRDP